ncbi:SusC/RagA family TonB-linked outer membrane protein [Chitinophaga sp. GCM10012297]|uniref:TonB-dependent receptor n=1 Tax=Chitinophaga chungangae TaxID=2821488 RepID=A0ABS3YBV6_9BACT|nr:TonB-dependent receptor [Chitinophaga chungangae]MBO9152157.1 TonB-dependent receptor [Chitinophaga chungangae]
MNARIITTLMLCLAVFTAGFAQTPAASPGGNRTVTGKITDNTGEPLPGVTILLKGAKAQAMTNEMGFYSIRIGSATNAVLVFSFVGFHTKEAKLGPTATVYNTTLEPSVRGLNDVVVIGYGSIKRKDVTGSVGEVKVEDMQKAPVPSFEQALAGRVAGLQVSATDGQPGAPMQIVIRGNNSVTQDNSPLFVIDGFPVEQPDNNAINPAEIESIEVLKDASATAIYGARGANGVIIITTKKGKMGTPTVSYQTWMGTQKIPKQQEMMDPYEFVKYQLEVNPALYTDVYLRDGKTLEDYRNVEGINWQDLVFRKAFMQNHNLALRGGTDRTKYSFSGNMMSQDGIIINSGFNRYQGRLVLDQTVSDKLKAGMNVNYTATKTYGTFASTTSQGNTSSLMYSIWGYRPVTGDPETDVSIIDEPFDPAVDPMNEYRVNPVISNKNEYNPRFGNTLTANAYVEYKPIKHLTLRVTGGLTKIAVRQDIFNNSNTRLGNPKSSVQGVNGSVDNAETTNLLNENTLTYARVFNKKHSLNVVGGGSLQQVSYYRYGYTASQVPNESLGMSGLDEGIINTAPTVRSTNRLMSFLGRVNYSYDGKYLFTASFRSDGSSKFPDGNKWAYFPSGAVAWRLIEEPFMKGITWLSDAKVRAGYGLTGNNRVADFAYLSSLQQFPYSGYVFGNSVMKGTIPSNLGNQTLKWETTAQTDFGIDVGFFKNRITLTTDYYKKNTKDLLLFATLAPSTGYLSGYRNVGRVSNEGLEFTLNTINIQNKKFTWSSNFNISFNRNRVVQLNEGEPSYASRITWGNFNNAYPHIAIPGHPIAMFYGFLFDGIYQFSDFNQLANGTYVLKDNIPDNGSPRANIKPGYVRYKDINQDGQVDNSDLTLIGNPNPVHAGGFSNNFTYANFDLNVFFQWSYGNDLLNANRIVFENGEARSYLNMFKSYEKRWTPENPSNELYRVGGQGPLVYSSRTIEDGSYLRLKTVALGYNVPAKVLKRAHIQALRVYGSAQNLITWTNYSGPDPEVSVRPSALTPGFDWSAYPKARTVTFGLDLTF